MSFTKNMAPYTLICFLIIIFLCTSCDKDPTVEIQDYRWSKDSELPFSDPVYGQESYFFFTKEASENEMYLIRLDEKTGDTIYNVKIFDIENLSLGYTKAYTENNELHFIISNRFYKIDMETGTVKTRYDFPHKLQDVNIQEQLIYFSAYASEGGVYFAYFDKDIGKEQIIYTAQLSGDQPSIRGLAPRVCGNSLVLPLSRGMSNNMQNQLIEINQDTTAMVSVNDSQNWIINVISDEENIYLFTVNKMFAYSKLDLSVKWEMPIPNSSIGCLYQTDEKIYSVPFTDVNVMNIINKNTGNHETIDGGSCRSDLIRIDDFIYYLGVGEFLKFDVINEQYVESNVKDSDVSFGSNWAISSNSKVIFNGKVWRCFPN